MDTHDTNHGDVNSSDGFDNLPPLSIEIGTPPDEDIHRWLFCEALRLRKQGVPAQMCETEMTRASDTQWRPRREIPQREIQGAVHDAYNMDMSRVVLDMDSAVFRFDPVHGWPDYMIAINEAMDEPRSREFLSNSECKSVAQLRERSKSTPELPLLHLFDQDDLICCGLASNLSRIELASEWGPRASRMQFLVPNPMRGYQARNKSGKPSARCRANVGPRRYLVIEMDKKCLSKDDQAGILWGLGSSLPLVLVVDSGNKSLHGWFNVDGIDPLELRDWFRGAVILGADHVTWKPEQYVRMPGGTRYDESGREVAHQEVLYFNPLNIHP